MPTPTATSTSPLTPNIELLDAADVTRITTIARASWYRLLRKGLFPSPVRVPGLRAQRWRVEDVQAWLHGVLVQAVLEQGAHLSRAKNAHPGLKDTPGGIGRRKYAKVSV
jgi:predicted DNA-binding transcriptional regulator AlpA